MTALPSRSAVATWLPASAAMLSVALLAASASLVRPAAAADVPYVPTSETTVREMLDIVGVGRGDVVYDLGCGDGRIVITAVKDYGATRGVGIDIDPARIRDSNENAERAGVTERVRFIEGDLFDADIEEASVVTLYLLPAVNLRLRPKLLAELKPGTRVVSHSFTMGAWEPDKVGRSGSVYHWVIPANVNGTWQIDVPAAGGSEQATLRALQAFHSFAGSLTLGDETVVIRDGVVSGDSIRFAADTRTGRRIFEGTVRGDAIEGVSAGRTAMHEAWRARRQPGTRQPIDSEETGRRADVASH